MSNEEFERELADDMETMVPCPVCERCAGCHDARMVSPARAARLRFDPEPPPEVA